MNLIEKKKPRPLHVKMVTTNHHSMTNFFKNIQIKKKWKTKLNAELKKMNKKRYKIKK